MNYVPLHVHTTVSPDGLGTIQNLMGRVSELGMTHCACTDHGTLAGAVAFWGAAKEYGVKPIFGNEVYIVENGKRGHLTVLSSGAKGFENLIALNNAAHRNKDSRNFPITTLEMLYQFNEGLLVLSGCSASPIYFGSEADGMRFAGQLFDIFKDRFYAEVMGVIPEDNFSRPMFIAKKLGIKAVVTTDTHFARKEDAGAHVVMTQCRKGYDYSSGELYLKSADELIKNPYLSPYADKSLILRLMANTVEVAERIETHDLAAPPSLPKTDGEVINIFSKAVEAATRLKVAKENVQRLEKEIDVIKSLGLKDYFSILFDIVDFCKTHGIKIGPGRGSGGGSYFLYLLGITDVDPIEHGLLFERFLSLSRGDMADFDLDVEAERRDEVIRYAFERWGAYPIANFATYSHASLIRDLGRYFNVPKSIVEEGADSEEGVALDTFFTYCKHASGASAEALARHSYKVMLGQIRHKGKHAGGVVIATRPVPIEDGIVSWTEGKSRELSSAGLVKYDILGVSALTQLAEMERLAGVAPGNPWDSDSDKVFKLFQGGDLAGIFQFSGSAGITRLTMEVSPQSLADLAAINALYRPGPLDSGMAWEYPKAKRGGVVRKLDPRIDGILKETYGVLVFQEQVMALVATVTGGNLEEADNIRKVISKGKVGDPKWQAKMREAESHFKVEGYKTFSKKVVDTLWNEIVTFGRYGFNKSHSVAYSLLAYRMAWYKCYYPAVFYTAMLNGDAEKVVTWVYDAAIHGVSVVPPHINKSGKRWVYDGEGAIYAPLSAIKFLGETGVDAVLVYRKEKGGEFSSFEELSKIPKRNFNIRSKKLLYYAGAFSGLTGDIKKILPDFEDLPQLTQTEAQTESLGWVLPTEAILNFIKGEADSGRVAGFIQEKEMRNKGRGDYVVFRLSPSGSFWLRDEKTFNKLNEGDLVSASLKNGGQGERVRKFKL